MRLWLVVAVGFCALWSPVGRAQDPVHPQQRYERLLLVVPLIGAGTQEDPRRPLFAPLPPATDAERKASLKSGIIGFAYQPSDDGQLAIVELVARDRAAFRHILAAAAAGPLAGTPAPLAIFHKGYVSRAEVVTEFRKYKKDFDPDRFEARAP